MVTQHSLRRTVRVSLRRCLAGVAALALAGSMAASPAQAATSPAPASDNVLRIATDGFIDSFNPFTSFYLVPTNTFRYMYENLVANDAKDGSVTEGLATEWNTDSEGKVWTYTIRPDMKWSDGEPLTAKDVAWTYNQMMENEEMAVANGTPVIEVNPEPTPLSASATVSLREKAAAALPDLLQRLPALLG